MRLIDPRLWIGLCLLAWTALPAWTQVHPTYLPDKVGVWKPLQMSCSSSGRGLTAEQNRLYSAKLLKLSETIHQSRGFNPPMGIEARPTGCVNATIEFLDDYPGNQKGPIPGYLMIGTFSYAYYSGSTKVEVADEGPHFFVDVNSLVRLYSNSGEVARDESGKIFPLVQDSRPVQGLPTYNGSIIITRNPHPIFLPVSAETFLQARIKQAQTELAKLRAEHQRQAGEYSRWLAGRDKREQERQRAYQNMKAIAPQNAENYRRISEEGDRKRGEMLKADADNAGIPTTAEQFKQAELNRYQAELNTLSPQQRIAQGWYSWNHGQRQPLLANPNEPDARPLVRFNPDFFDRSRPRTDIQSLVVGRLYDRSYREKSYDPQYQRIIDFRKSFDFQNLVLLLDQ